MDRSRKDLGTLPSSPTTFIGRQDTITRIRESLAHDRLMTIVGPGGCGKTRLAVEVARSALPSFRDGAFFVDFSGISDLGLVPSAVSQALRLVQPPEGASAEVLARQLAEREALLVLDNCEHLASACAALVRALIAGCPRLHILATSRERLQIDGESVVAIEGLELPGGETCVEASEAGALFLDLARRARADFTVGESGLLAIAEICERLDGIPLALELAAARTRMMSIDAIAEGLSDRFRLLVGTSRSGPPRQKTLRASIEWSWGLLADDESCLLRRLAVFASGFTIGAAEAVCCGGDVERGDVLRMLTALVDKSLVQAQVRADRFRLHETIREYSSAALDNSGELPATRDRHLDYFFALAEALQPDMYSEMASSVRVFEADVDNFRAALDWSVESKQFRAGSQLIFDLGPVFYSSGFRPEALGRCEQFLAAPLEPLSRAKVLDWAWLFTWHKKPDAARPMGLELTALGRSLGDDRWVAHGMNVLAAVQMVTEPEETIRTVDELLPIALRTNDHMTCLSALIFKANALSTTGRPADALAACDAAIRGATERGWSWGATFAQSVAAGAAIAAGDMDRALGYAEAVSQAAETLSDALFTMSAESTKGRVSMYRGEPGAAEKLGRARASAEASFDRVNLSQVKASQGELQVRLGHLAEGYELLTEAAAEAASLTGHRDAVIDALLADVALWRGDASTARDYVGTSGGLPPAAIGPALVPLLRAEARLARSEGDPLESVSLVCDGLEGASQAGARLAVVDLLELVAMASSDLGRAKVAARLLGAVERQREVIGYVRGWPASAELAPVVLAIETALGPNDLECSWSEGRALGLAEAVAYARRGRGRRGRPDVGWGSLTPTEREVALLVAQRLSNAQIGARLFISTVTVKSHLSRAFTKLGVKNRTQLGDVTAAHTQMASRQPEAPSHRRAVRR